MKARLLAGGLAAAALAVLVPAAQAKTEQVSLAAGLLRGPVLVEGTTLWLESTARGVAVESANPGVRPQLVARRTYPRTFEDEDTGEFRTASGVGFSAGTSHVLIDSRISSGSGKYFQYDYDLSSDAYPRAGGASRRIGACRVHVDRFNNMNAQGPPDPGSAVDGNTAVASSCPHPVIVDLATGATLRELPELGLDPRLAGRYVASLVTPATGPKQVLVYDWQAGADAYRITLAAATKVAAFDLQADGSVALVQFAGAAGCGTGRLSWHSLAEPGGRELPVAPCAAAVGVDGGKAAVAAAAPGAAGRLVVAEVGADGARRDLAWLGSGQRRVGAIDYAGGIAAYAVRGCTGVASIMNSDGPPEPRALDCVFPRLKRVRILGRKLRVTGTTDDDFSGPLVLRYRLRVGTRIFTVQRTVGVRSGDFTALLTLPASIRSRRAARHGRLRASFAGDEVFQRATVSRLVTTPRPRGP
jgi:hypothetical protein